MPQNWKMPWPPWMQSWVPERLGFLASAFCVALAVLFVKSIYGAALVVALMWLLMGPIARYVWVGWDVKKLEITSNFSEKAKALYFNYFLKDQKPEDAASGEFDAFYEKRYGRRYFIAPCAMLFCVALGLSLLVAEYVFSPSLKRESHLGESAVFALAGAYLWVVSDFISRARRRDFAPADVMWGALRLVIAVPLGYAFSAAAAGANGLAGEQTPAPAASSTLVGAFVPFALAAFPLGDIMTASRKLATRYLPSDSTNQEPSRDPLIKLQGITKDVNNRLVAEDITTIGQLAYCDPVQLAMRSNLSFNFIVDIVSQVLAWQFFEDQLIPARPYGVRTSFEIKTLIDDTEYRGGDSKRKEDAERARRLLPVLANVMRVDQVGLEFAFRVIARDPYSLFLYEVWNWDAVGAVAHQRRPHGASMDLHIRKNEQDEAPRYNQRHADDPRHVEALPVE